MIQQHGFADKPGFSLPFVAGLVHVRHCADKGIVWIGVMGLHQLVQKRRIFRRSIGIKNKNSMRSMVVYSLKHYALTGVTPIPPVRKTAGILTLL